MDAILSYEMDPEDDYYNILGCDEKASMEQIVAEYKTLVLACHPDKNPDDQESVNLFTQLQRAKEVLIDEKRRKEYDAWRHCGLAIPYKKWCSLHNKVQTSMHWANITKTDPMIEARAPPRKSSSQDATDDVFHGGPQDEPDSAVTKPTPHASGNKPNEFLREFRENDAQPPSEMLIKFRNYEI